MFNKVFISYAREDLQIAKTVYSLLKEKQFEPWLDIESIKPGQIWIDEIKSALKNADFIILILSYTSVSKRGIIQTEFKLALDYCTQKLKSDSYIVPLKIDECAIPFELENFQYINFHDENSHKILLETLSAQQAKYFAVENLKTSRIIIKREQIQRCAYLHN